MKTNENTKIHKIAVVIGKIIGHLLFAATVWLITYGYLTVTSNIFCFGVSLRSSTAACSLVLIIYYFNFFVKKKARKKQ